MSLAPRPWRVDGSDEQHKPWKNACAIVDAGGSVVCYLTRGYQGDMGSDGISEDCPSWDNAQLIVDAVNSFRGL
jgi:hypothetical protein